MATKTEREEGVRVDTVFGKLALPHAPNDVVFFTVSVAGLIAVLWKLVDRIGDSGALLIGAMLRVLTRDPASIAKLRRRGGAAFRRVRACPGDYRVADCAAPSSSASSGDSP